MHRFQYAKEVALCCHCLLVLPDEVFNECRVLGVDDGWRGGAGACCFAAVIFETPRLFSVYNGTICGAYKFHYSIMNIKMQLAAYSLIYIWIHAPGYKQMSCVFTGR